MVLATRFITFDTGHLIVLQHLPHKPTRDYGPFTTWATERSRPIPSIVWDSQVTRILRMGDLKEVHLLNYRMIEHLDDPDETLVEVYMIFGQINHDYVPVVHDEVI